MSDDIEINLDDPEDIGIAVDDDSPISVEMPEGGQDGRSIHPAGEWSDAVEYAYLNLVTHEGSSYTAVRAVPAGTELTDTYYWQLTAEKGDQGDPGTPVWGTITGDLSDQTDLADALDAKAPVITETASGSIASFTDGSASPVTALSVSIEPVQEGTGDPSPGTPITLPVFEQGTINGSGNLENSSTRVRTSDFFIANGSNYRIEFDADKVATVRVYSPSGPYLSGESITSWTASPISLTITNGRKVKIVLAYSDNSNIVPADVTKCNVLEGYNVRPITGHTACNIYHEAEYDPTANPKVTIDLGEERYGSVIDVLTGEMTVTHKLYTITSMRFTGSQTTINQYYTSNSAWKNPDFRARWYTQEDLDRYGIKCNIAPIVPGGLTDVISASVYAGGSYVIQPRIAFPLSMGIDTLTKCNAKLQEWDNAGTPLQFTLPLATPLTVQLTPSQMQTLLGQNNIWADTGDISVTYRADTKLYIDGKFSQLQALILEN